MKNATTLLTPASKTDIKYSTLQGFNTGDSSAFAKTMVTTTNRNLETSSVALTGQQAHAPNVSAFRNAELGKTSNRQSTEQFARSVMERTAINAVQAQEQNLRQASLKASTRQPQSPRDAANTLKRSNSPHFGNASITLGGGTVGKPQLLPSQVLGGMYTPGQSPTQLKKEVQKS